MRLQGILPKGWCPEYNKDHHGVIPDDERRAVSSVRRHGEELKQLQFGKADATGSWANRNSMLRSKWGDFNQESLGPEEIHGLQKLQKLLETAQFLADRSCTCKLLRGRKAYVKDTLPNLGYGIIVGVVGMLWCLLVWSEWAEILHSGLAEDHIRMMEKSLLLMMVVAIVPGVQYIVMPLLRNIWQYITAVLKMASSCIYCVEGKTVALNAKLKKIKDEIKCADQERATYSQRASDQSEFGELLSLSDTGKALIYNRSAERRHAMHNLNFARMLEIKERLLKKELTQIRTIAHTWVEGVETVPGADKLKEIDALKAKLDAYKTLTLDENEERKPPLVDLFGTAIVTVERHWQSIQQQRSKTVDEFCVYCAHNMTNVVHTYEDLNNVEQEWSRHSLSTDATRQLSKQLNSASFEDLDDVAEEQVHQEAVVIWDRVQLSELFPPVPCFVRLLFTHVLSSSIPV